MSKIRKYGLPGSLLLMLIFGLVGCSTGGQKTSDGKETKHIEASSHTASTDSDFVEESFMHNEGEEMSSDGQTDESEATEENQFPYAVDINELITSEDVGGAHPVITGGAVFSRPSSVNSPSRFEFRMNSFGQKAPAVYIYPPKMGEEVREPDEYLVGITQVPTQTIKIFSADGKSYEDRREVKVNTRIELMDPIILKRDQEDQTEFKRLHGHVFYAFHNKQGTISLATENFAGNVSTTEETYIMAEYLQEQE